MTGKTVYLVEIGYIGMLEQKQIDGLAILGIYENLNEAVKKVLQHKEDLDIAEDYVLDCLGQSGEATVWWKPMSIGKIWATNVSAVITEETLITDESGS